MKFFTTVILACAANLLLAQWQPTNSSSTDNGNIYHLNGNVGIGTNTPGTNFHLFQGPSLVTKSAHSRAIFESNDHSQLDVLSGTNKESAIYFKSTGSAGLTFGGIGYYHEGTSNYGMSIYSGNSIRMRVLDNGYVGIGIITPSTKLHVNGALRIEPATGGVVGTATGSRIELSSGGTTSIEENWGINLIGNDGSPVKVRNAALLVGYTSSSAGWGTGGNLLVQGNAGFGTTSPSTNFHIFQGASSLTKSTYSRAIIESSDHTQIDVLSGANKESAIYFKSTGSSGLTFGGIGYYHEGTSNYGMSLYAGNTIKMRILDNGNVGIGTTRPDALLAVKGQIHANEVKVDLNVQGPDYVFEKDYKLTSLEEIKNYIDQNKHLPEVPSAKEMEKNGVQLGEMNMLLLKKIEELTLYVIEQNRKIEGQNKKIELQGQEINTLKNKTK